MGQRTIGWIARRFAVIADSLELAREEAARMSDDLARKR